MTMDDLDVSSLLWEDSSNQQCKACKEYESRELEMRRTITILKQKMISHEKVIVRYNQMLKLIEKTHLELSQREKQLGDCMQEQTSLKLATTQLESLIKSRTDELNNLKEKLEITEAVNQQLEAALKNIEKECTQQKTELKQLKMKKPKNNKAKSKDNDMEQIKWVISAILKMSLYFAQTLEKHNWLSPKCSSKVNRLFKNPKSMLQVLKSNVNGCSKDLQEIFAITKINEMTHEKDDDSFDEDDEDGMILQDLLTAEQKDIAPITFPTSPDEIVIKSPEKSFQCKLIQNSPPTTPSRELIPNPPQKTPPRKLTLNSPPKKVTPKSSPRELSYSKTPSTHSPQELVSQNSLQKLNTKNLLYKSNILPLNLPKKNFNQKTPLHNSPSKSLIHNLIAKNSPQETLDKDRDAAVELKNPLQKIPLVQDNYCLLKSFVRSQEQMSNGHMRSLLINDPQNSSQNRLNEDGEVENKIKEIFSVMIFHERPISPLPSKFENCEDDENILLKHKPNDEVQNKSTAFSTKLKSRGSKRIRPVTKIYCLNKERKLTDETKLKLPDPTRNHLAQYSEDKLSFDEPMDGDDANNSNQLDETEAELPDTTGNHLAQSSEDKMSFDEPMDGDEANNSNQLAEIVLNLGNNDNDLNAKVSQDSDKISPCNDLVKSTGIEESIECVTSANESVEDTSRLKNKEFICKDSPKIKGCISNDFYKTNCSVPSESSEKEVDFELSESAVSLSASILKDYEQRSLGNSVSESNKKSGSPLDLRISEMLLNFRLSKSTKDETVADAPDTDLSILHENSKTSVSIISNRAEVDDCSKTEITTDDDNEVIENLETNSISEDIFDEMQDKILICSPTRIIANTILDEICKTVCANNETISLVPDVPKPPESYNDIICQSDTAVSASEDFLSRALNDDKQLDRFPVVSNNSEKSNGASLAGERSEKTFLPTCVDFDEDNSVFSSPGCDNLVIDEKIECTQKITLFEDSNEIEPHESPIGALAMCLDSDDENSVCNNLVIDARLERTPSLRLSLSSNEMIERTPRLRLFSSSDEIESPESPTAELPLCVDIPEIPLSPQLPRYWTRSRIHENNTKPSPTVNSIRKHFRGKDLSNTGINETILQDASPNCMAFCSPVMTLISPLPSTPVTSAVTCNDSTRVCSMTADESGKYVDPRSSVRRRISLISSPEKLNSQYTTDGIENNSNGIVIEDKSTCQTKAIKRKSEENGMATRKRPKCEVEVKQAAIRNGKSEHRMCTRLSLRIEKMDITNEQVEEKRSNSAQEIKRTLAQEKRKRAQEKGKQAQEAKRKQVQENKMKRIEEAKLKQIEEAKKKQAQEEKRKQAQERKFEAKKNKTQSKNKSRGRRGALQKIVNIEVSAAEKRPLVVPMHLILLIKNGITELKECRLDLTEKFCDNARDRNVSVFTDEEKIFLQRVMDKTKRINNLAKKRALDTLFEYLNAAIFKDSTVHTLGRASLCRFYCAICKYLDKLDLVKKLCYDLLLKMTDVAGFFIFNILDALPASGQFYEVIQYVLVNYDIGLTSSMKTYITLMFSEIHCTTACDIYVENLFLRLRELDEGAEIEWSFGVIAAAKGWSWAKENLILKYLWPTITEWGEYSKKLKSNNHGNGHLSDGFVTSIFKIFGLVCQKCPPAESQMIIGFMKELRVLLRTVNLNLVPSLVQEGVIEAIIRLEKFRPDITRLALKFWLTTAKHVISLHLQVMIDQVATKMNVNSAELVEGWT